MYNTRMYPYFLFHETKNDETIPDIKLLKVDDRDIDALIDKMVNGPRDNEWAKVTALLHNKEMHSQNGNIDKITDCVGSREEILKTCRQFFWNSPTIPSLDTDTDSLIVMKDCLLRYHPTLYYNRGSEINSKCLTNVGTLHQHFMDGETIRALLKPEKSTKVDAIPKQAEIIPITSQETVNGENMTNTSSKRSNEGCTPYEGGVSGSVAVSQVTSFLSDIILIGETMLKEHKLLGSVYTNNKSLTPMFQGRLTDRDKSFKEAVEVQMWMSISHGDCEAYCKIKKMRQTMLTIDRLLEPYIFAKNDYRILAIKVDLYDELREKRLVQPTGVEWAWTYPNSAPKAIIPLNTLGDWSYDAIFVTLDTVEYAIQNGNVIPVVKPQEKAMKINQWNLCDQLTLVIPLDNAEGSDPIGKNIWVLAHLRYPLAWVMDCFPIWKVGSTDPIHRLFNRTAGLVDISDRFRRIIFVTTSKTTNIVTLGTTSYKVFHVSRDKVTLHDEDIPIVHNIDENICKMLEFLLNIETSLREHFSIYTAAYFPEGINWLEINSITTALTVRYHPRIEGKKSAVKRDAEYVDTVTYTGAPAQVLTAYGLQPDEKVTNEAFDTYGGSRSVNGLDQRYVSRKVSKMHPAILLGNWNGLVSLSLTQGYIVCNTLDVEDRELAERRMQSGGLDRLMRGRFMRKAFEQWKRSAAQSDYIAFPFDFPRHLHYWPGLIMDSGKGCTTEWFAKIFISKYVCWAWDMNMAQKDKGKSTRTGIRTISSWWRTTINAGWSDFSISQTRPLGESHYQLDLTSISRFYNYWVQFGIGEDDPQLESFLMRLDMNNALHWGLKYKSHPRDDSFSTVTWVVDSSYGERLAQSLGWVMPESVEPKRDKWGWGVAVRLKDYDLGVLKTIAVPIGTGNTAKNVSSPHVILLN